MTWESIDTLYLTERNAVTLDIPLTDEDGGPLQPASVSTITAQMTVGATGQPVWDTPRDVTASLDDGTLALALTSDDLARVTTREIEVRTLTISILYATNKERHIVIPCELRRAEAAYDMTP